VTVANNGLEALEAIKNRVDRVFDIVLMDVQMPIMVSLKNPVSLCGTIILV